MILLNFAFESTVEIPFDLGRALHERRRRKYALRDILLFTLVLLLACTLIPHLSFWGAIVIVIVAPLVTEYSIRSMLHILKNISNAVYWAAFIVAVEFALQFSPFSSYTGWVAPVIWLILFLRYSRVLS